MRKAGREDRPTGPEVTLEDEPSVLFFRFAQTREGSGCARLSALELLAFLRHQSLYRGFSWECLGHGPPKPLYRFTNLSPYLLVRINCIPFPMNPVAHELLLCLGSPEFMGSQFCTADAI